MGRSERTFRQFLSAQRMVTLHVLVPPSCDNRNDTCGGVLACCRDLTVMRNRVLVVRMQITSRMKIGSTGVQMKSRRRRLLIPTRMQATNVELGAIPVCRSILRMTATNLDQGVRHPPRQVSTRLRSRRGQQLMPRPNLLLRSHLRGLLGQLRRNLHLRSL